jgi:hypothetical protein
MDTLGPDDPIPVWVINTLLMNMAFGLPGGDAPGPDVTVAALEGLMRLVTTAVYPSMPSIDMSLSPMEREWKQFIIEETHKR